MPWVEYVEIHNESVEHKIQTCYAEALQQVQVLGFHEEYAVCEKHFPFSFFLEADIAQDLASLGAVWQQGPMASLLICIAVAIHDEGYAYATVLKDRVKFVTMFEDQTIVHTSAYRRYIRRSVREHKYIFQLCRTDSICDAWAHHQRCVEHVAKPWNPVVSLLNVQTAMQIEQRISEIQLSGADAEMADTDESKEKRKAIW